MGMCATAAAAAALLTNAAAPTNAAALTNAVLTTTDAQPSHAPPRHQHHHHPHHPRAFLDGAIVNGTLRFEVIPSFNAFDPSTWPSIGGAGVPGTCNLVHNSSSVAIEPHSIEFGVAQATSANVATVDISTSGAIILRHTLSTRFLAQTITLASTSFVGCTLLTGPSDHPVAIASNYDPAAGAVTLHTPDITAAQLVTYSAAWRLDCPLPPY